MDQGLAKRRGRPPRTEAQRADQRARLLAGVMEAVRTKGPDVSIEDMAAVAGVSKPVLYDEFGGKLGVADAVAVELADRIQLTVISAVVASGELMLDHAVRTVVDGVLDVIETEPELYAFLVRSLRSSDRGLLDNALVRVVHEKASLLINLVAPGAVESEVDVLSAGVFGFVFAAVEAWATTKQPARAELVDLLASIIDEGIRTVASRAR